MSTESMTPEGAKADLATENRTLRKSRIVQAMARAIALARGFAVNDARFYEDDARAAYAVASEEIDRLSDELEWWKTDSKEWRTAHDNACQRAAVNQATARAALPHP